MTNKPKYKRFNGKLIEGSKWDGSDTRFTAGDPESTRVPQEIYHAVPSTGLNCISIMEVVHNEPTFWEKIKYWLEITKRRLKAWVSKW